MNSKQTYPLEDRAMKAAARLLGEELLPLLGIKETICRIAPTEQVFLEFRDFSEDFNYEMSDGSWLHLEFESDNITEDDMMRFRAYEAVISYHYKVPVITCIVCSSSVGKRRDSLSLGINTYHVRAVYLKDKNADQLIRDLEQQQQNGTHLQRQNLLLLLLTPLMDGSMAQTERFCRSIQMLQKEREYLKNEDLMQMQAVLYLLAMKFLTAQELNHVKEELKMTILGQMLWQDGLEEGIEKGIEKGIEQGTDRVNQLIQYLSRQNRSDEILKAAENKEYQKKLFEEFNL